MRRRKLLAVLVLALVVVGAFMAWLRPQSRITEENFNRVGEGMTLQQVEALLGPAGDFRTGPADARTWRLVDTGKYGIFCTPDVRSPPGMGGTVMSVGYRQIEWKTDTAHVTVCVKPPDQIQFLKLAPGESPVDIVIDASYCDTKLEYGP